MYSTFISNKQKTFLASWKPLTKRAESGSVNHWYIAADPNPYQNDTDPQTALKYNLKKMPLYGLSVENKCVKNISFGEKNSDLYIWFRIEGFAEEY